MLAFGCQTASPTVGDNKLLDKARPDRLSILAFPLGDSKSPVRASAFGCLSAPAVANAPDRHQRTTSADDQNAN